MEILKIDPQYSLDDRTRQRVSDFLIFNELADFSDKTIIFR